jgi:hypothetical protein
LKKSKIYGECVWNNGKAVQNTFKLNAIPAVVYNPGNPWSCKIIKIVHLGCWKISLYTLAEIIINAECIIISHYMLQCNMKSDRRSGIYIRSAFSLYFATIHMDKKYHGAFRSRFSGVEKFKWICLGVIYCCTGDLSMSQVAISRLWSEPTYAWESFAESTQCFPTAALTVAQFRDFINSFHFIYVCGWARVVHYLLMCVSAWTSCARAIAHPLKLVVSRSQS